MTTEENLSASREDAGLREDYFAWRSARARLIADTDFIPPIEPGFHRPGAAYLAATTALADHAPHTVTGLLNMLTAASLILAARETEPDSMLGEANALGLIVAAMRGIVMNNYDLPAE